MGVVTSSTDDGVGSSAPITSCASEGATPQGSMTMKLIPAVRNTTAIDVDTLRALNRHAQRNVWFRFMSILLTSFLFFLSALHETQIHNDIYELRWGNFKDFLL
jgi:hypothetical protein